VRAVPGTKPSVAEAIEAPVSITIMEEGTAAQVDTERIDPIVTEKPN